MASRAASATVLGFLAEHVGNMIVSSADLANSDKTDGFLKKTTVLCKEDFTGGFLRISAEIRDSLVDIGTGCRKRLSVCGYRTFERIPLCIHSASRHDRITDDQSRFFLLFKSLLQSTSYCERICAVNLYYIPVPCAILRSCVFISNIGDIG